MLWHSEHYIYNNKLKENKAKEELFKLFEQSYTSEADLPTLQSHKPGDVSKKNLEKSGDFRGPLLPQMNEVPTI